MKSVLVYGCEDGNHPTLELISREIAAGFEQIGCNVFYCPFTDCDKVQEGYYKMQDGEIDFSIGLNNFPSIMLNDKGESCYKNLGVPYVSILLDAPYNPAVGNMLFDCKNHFVCVLDKSHVSLIDDIYSSKKFMGKMFLPLGGISGGNEDELFSRERSYNVVFASSIYGNGDPGRKWHEALELKPYCNLLYDIADYLINNPVSVDEGVRYILNQRGLYDDIYRKKMLPFYFLLFLYIKAIRRVKSLEFLVKNDIVVDVFGAGWENVPLVHSKYGKNIRLHGQVPYEAVLDITSKAKIVYQDQAEFNNGAHDRVFSSMLSGAVVVSEYSTYLEKEFKNGSDIFLYDWKNGLSQVQIIDKLLNDESVRLSAAVSAYGKVNNKHRWKNRAQSIMEAMSFHED